MLQRSVACAVVVLVSAGCVPSIRSDGPDGTTTPTTDAAPENSVGESPTGENPDDENSAGDNPSRVSLPDLGIDFTLPDGFSESTPDPGARTVYLASRSDPAISIGVVPCKECVDIDADTIAEFDMVGDSPTTGEIDGVPTVEAIGVDTERADVPFGNQLWVLRGDRSLIITMAGQEDIDDVWQRFVDSIEIDD